eukprot:gnl/MRDRNA2_/MRDRNA2_16937_c0_seq1.p1 gnl/MRDRNA2_/MRDRNA2_16937_c0~~gnl/MRDRNA2_/MRDRNA2_16937_c0_seq1.p1  ORF type:complete len:137 (+),score=27.21 gnl/MRDRNA2_/MRDRNA2_16937_c0_seq1:2-412(+)
MSEEEQLEAAIRLSMQQPGSPKSSMANMQKVGDFELSREGVADLMKLLFGDQPDPLDVQRWFNVGFQLSTREDSKWGLWQTQGGPCGVFAPIQGLMLKHILFGEGVADVNLERSERLRSIEPSECSSALVHALSLR